jgi:UDP-galactopyranose mutase
MKYKFCISLYDTKSDGWNNNYISVLSIDNVIIFDKITLGPDDIVDDINKKNVYFELDSSKFIIKYYDHEGFYSYENYYTVYCDNDCIFHGIVGEAPNKEQIIEISTIAKLDTSPKMLDQNITTNPVDNNLKKEQKNKCCNNSDSCNPNKKCSNNIHTKYDVLIVGCGLYAATFAQQCIQDKKRVLIIEKRSHIAGNCYTKKIGNIDVHEYGPHIFHTNSDDIWNYVNKFTKFNNFINSPKVIFDNKLFSFPINLMTLYQLWGINTPEEARKKLDSVRIPINEPSNLEEWILSQVGEEIYHTFIYGYTKKQWNTEPKNLPAFIIRRLPIRLSFNDNYFTDKYQGIPINGYTDMIQNMLEGSHVILNVDYFANKELFDSYAKTVVYTGPIDTYFNYEFGKLNYRSLKFEHSILPTNDYQGNAIINYTDYNIPYTRIIEHKHFTNIQTDYTAISKEFPQDFNDNEPYYPINNEENNSIYDKYKLHSSKLNNVIFGGRLAEYKYYDMHQIIGSALTAYKKYNV